MADTKLTATRNRIIDTAKGLGMILIVFAHANYIEPGLSFLYSFHLPLFFILSGLVFKPERYDSFSVFFKKRLKSLILPYLIFAALSVGVQALLDIWEQGFSVRVLKNFLYNGGEIFIARYSQTMRFNIPLWFVPCLFVLECMYFWLAKIKNRALFGGAVLALVCFGWFACSPYCFFDFSVLPWNFAAACFSVGFFAVGHLCQGKLLEKISGQPSLTKRLIMIASAALCFAGVLIVRHYNGHISIGSQALNNGLLLYLSAIWGSMGVLLLAQLLSRSRILNFFGRESFCIMATHHLFLNIILAGYQQFRGGKIQDILLSWPKSLLVFVAILLGSGLCTIVTMRIKKIRH